MTRFRSFVAFLSFVLLSVSIAATPKPAPRPAAAAPPVNRVVMTLRDGTSVGGELVEATPAGVTIKPSPKSAPVTKPWSAIRQLSNGVTHESIVAQWRTSQKELLCDACDGNGATTCPTCNGKAIDPATAAACDKCGGTGTTGACKTPRCVDGKIPCPLNCLKPGDFHGKPDAEGKRWKSIPAKGGVARISDAHLGELIVMQDGLPMPGGKCPRCNGTSVIDDPACHGTGKQTCATCKGKGVVGPPCQTCKDGSVVCTTCSGTGLKSAATQPATKEPA